MKDAGDTLVSREELCALTWETPIGSPSSFGI